MRIHQTGSLLARLRIVEGAGHFPRVEVLGSVLEAIVWLASSTGQPAPCGAGSRGTRSATFGAVTTCSMR